MESLEIEVKFHLKDIQPMRSLLLDLGADSLGRVFETNLCFEDDNQSLIKKKSLLRLRSDSKSTLTFKSEPPEKDSHFKVHRELEVEISNFATMKLILESLGFHVEQVYEKWRETFEFNGTLFCIDTLPFGNFLEIEGERKNIRNLSHKMGLKWEKRILSNYLELFDIIGKKSNLLFSDITFNNFKNITLDINEYIHRFEVGGK